MAPHTEAGSVALRIVGWTAVVLLLIAILVPVAALSLSVRVEGESMLPTLEPDDRLMVDFLHKDDVERFDLVEASVGGGTRFVKRVVGLPGDQVRIRPVAGNDPVVLLRPAGSSETFRVRNPTWPGRAQSKVAACCGPRGKNDASAAWVTVPADSYWLLGDNWDGSTDSRELGFVAQAEVAAKMNFRILPLGSFGKVPHRITLEKVAGR